MGRILEPEVMETEAEAKAYDELERRFGPILFQGFAESTLRMGVPAGRVLDVGTGPGRIAIRVARVNPAFRLDAIDLSKSMLELARRNAAEQGVADRVTFSVGDAKKIPFPDGTFDLVVCHNMLHQLPEPIITVREIVRVAKPDGAILIRDVRRLAKPLMDLALPIYCLGYGPVLRRLTYDSFRAGLTFDELDHLVREVGLERARVCRYWTTHIGVERPATGYKGRTAPPLPRSPWLLRFLKWPYVTRRPAC